MAQPKHNSELKENENGKTPMIIPKCLQNANQSVNLSDDLKIINPDIHELFSKYNKTYFDGEICFCEIKWIETKDSDPKDIENNKDKNGKKPASKKKKYAGRCIVDSSGFCCIELEKTILQFKSNKYLIETIIHQMIHSYLLLKNNTNNKNNKNNKKQIGHSNQFKLIMNAINKISSPSIKLTLNNKQCKQNDDYPSEIIPNQLYLGNIHHALNLETLKALKITHIVNCTQSIENKHELNGIGYCRVPVNDKTSESILHYFVKAIRFIESVRNQNYGKNNNRILIHCHAGISRSSTITIAYLMFSWKLTMFHAIAHVQSKRYIIQPNQGFKNQLLDFYLYLEENEGNLDDFEKKYHQKKQQQPMQQEQNNNNNNNNNHNNNDNVYCNPMQIINNNNNNKQIDKTKEYVACPVCDKFFTKKYINKHLDECVSY